VLQVDVRAGVSGQDDVACDDHVLGGVRPAAKAEPGGHHALVHRRPLGHGLVLAVIHDRQVEHLGVLDRAAHDLVVLHAPAVIGDGDDAGALQRTGGRKLLSLLADGDAPGRVDVDDRAMLDGIVDVLDRAGTVGHRRCVRHADDGGESAGGGGPRPSLNRLLVGLAGLAKCTWMSDEAGTGHEATRVNRLRLLLLLGGQAGNERPVGDEEIALGVGPGGRVDDAGMGDPEGTHDERSKSRLQIPRNCTQCRGTNSKLQGGAKSRKTTTDSRQLDVSFARSRHWDFLGI